jgi:hypothetical protein
MQKIGKTLLLVLITLPAWAQKNRSRILEFSGGDSVWVIKNGLVSRSRFFIGTERVTLSQWHQHLAKGNAEAGRLISKGTRQRRLSSWLAITGVAAVGTSLWMIADNSNSGNWDPNKRRTANLIAGLGIVATTTAYVFGSFGWAHYHRALRLYNDQILTAPKPSLSFSIRAGPTAAALVVNW